MASFVEKSNCRGMSVKSVAGAHHNLRPRITGRLLQERHVARYVVAPKGYGKSSVAYEYAQVVFGFAHTFWIEGDSPCFLRDLDDGSLSRQIRTCDARAQLVIFDNVPHLDPDRTLSFDAVIDDLLDAGIEVIVTCVPSVDTFTSVRPDKVMLVAKDLLLTDEEISVERMRGTLSGREGDIVAAAERAACLVWGIKGPQVLLEGFRAEELPGDLRLASLLVLLFGEGAFSDLEGLLASPVLADDLLFLEEHYPFLGVDVASRSFAPFEVEVTDVAKHLGIPLKELSSGSKEGAATLCKQIADKLLDLGHSARAVAFIEQAADGSVGAEWLAKVGWSMTLDLEPLAVDGLYERVRKHAASHVERVTAIGAWAAFVLYDTASAASRSRGVMRSAKADWQDLTACLVLDSQTRDDFVPADCAAALERIRQLQTMQGVADATRKVRNDPFDWECALELMDARCRGDAAMLDAWDGLARVADAGARPSPGEAPGCAGGTDADKVSNVLLLFGAWYLRDALRRDMEGPQARILWRRIADFASGRIMGGAGDAIPKWVRMVASEALRACSDAHPVDFALMLPPAIQSASIQMEAYLSGQSKELVRRRDQAELAKETYRLTHPDPFRAQGPSLSKSVAIRAHTPVLRIGLFGGFDAHIEDDACTPCTFGRRKAKLALALLAIGRGREVSRRRLTGMLWPGSDEAFCKRNFYVIWGSLKKELSVNGACPYLLRSQTGYRLDARFVVTDLDDFDRLSRSLLFGGEDVVSWEDVFEQVAHRFSEDFLPDVTDNEFVAELRARYKDQLIDGLISASTRLAMLGEPRGSLWFAREALRRDDLREDSYATLMRAQLAAGQRASALETYFTCRRVLVERLGIDPSSAIVELYNSIIESEEAF